MEKIIKIVIIFIISIFTVEKNSYGLPANPGPTGIPVFLGNPDNTGTYTGTVNNPINSLVRSGTITTIVNPIWQTQPISKCYYSVSNVPAMGSITISYASDTTTGYSQYIEYFIIVKDDTSKMGYCSFLIKNSNLVFLAGEITPASPQSIFQLPVPIKIDPSFNIELVIINKEDEAQAFKSSLIYSIRKN